MCFAVRVAGRVAAAGRLATSRISCVCVCVRVCLRERTRERVLSSCMRGLLRTPFV